MIKNFSSPKIKIWFEPMFFSGFFCGFERCGSPPALRLRRAGAAFPNSCPPKFSERKFRRVNGGIFWKNAFGLIQEYCTT